MSVEQRAGSDLHPGIEHVAPGRNPSSIAGGWLEVPRQDAAHLGDVLDRAILPGLVHLDLDAVAHRQRTARRQIMAGERGQAEVVPAAGASDEEAHVFDRTVRAGAASITGA